jgi:hypothetical protein
MAARRPARSGVRGQADADGGGRSRAARLHHAMVDTFDFQAPGFYQKLGYVEWGVLEDFPGGHRRIYFRKDL